MRQEHKSLVDARRDGMYTSMRIFSAEIRLSRPSGEQFWITNAYLNWRLQKARSRLVSSSYLRAGRARTTLTGASCRSTLRAGYAVAKAFLPIIRESVEREAIAGPTLGADPIVSAVSVVSHLEGHPVTRADRPQRDQGATADSVRSKAPLRGTR